MAVYYKTTVVKITITAGIGITAMQDTLNGRVMCG